MDPCGGNPRWENVDRSDLRIYTFILVIRLSKVKQSFTFRVSPRRRHLVELCAAVLGLAVFADCIA